MDFDASTLNAREPSEGEQVWGAVIITRWGWSEQVDLRHMVALTRAVRCLH